MNYIINKSPDEIAEPDIQRLIDEEVIETKVLDYKAELPGSTDKDRKEFLADVSSFSNTMGGDILLGVKQDNATGKPIGPLEGIEISNIDAVINKLENILLNGLEPQIPSYSYTISPILLSNSNYILMIRTSKSWLAPHRIAFKKTHRFYARNSNGKYLMDINELKAAIVISENLAEKIRAFKGNRVSMINANESHIKFNHQEILILHLIPFESFKPGINYDLTSRSISRYLKPIHSSSWNNRFNIDGIVSFEYLETRTPRELTYAQLYRNGIIEAAEDYIFQAAKAHSGGQKFLPFIEIEEYLISTIPNYFNIYKELGINPPISISLTLLELEGWGYPSRLFTSYPIDRDILQPSDILIDNYDENIAILLRPCFDSLWNACGRKESPNFDSGGNWRQSQHG